MTGYHEFMPWNVWIKQGDHSKLPIEEAKKKYEFDRNEHLKKLMYYENQEVIRKNMGEG